MNGPVLQGTGHPPTMSHQRFATFGRGFSGRASSDGGDGIGRRSFIRRMGAAGLVAAGATFGTLDLLASPAGASPGCCDLAFSTVKPIADMNECNCTGSEKYVWTCCVGSTKYGCGECYCHSWSAYGAAGTF